MIINWIAVAGIVLAVVVIYSCLVVAGRSDQWAEDNLGQRRS